MQHANAVITPVYWYFHCDFQQNIALFCAISDFLLLLLFADASCLIQCKTENCIFQGGNTGREVPVSDSGTEVHPILQPNRGSGGAS